MILKKPYNTIDFNINSQKEIKNQKLYGSGIKTQTN